MEYLILIFTLFIIVFGLYFWFFWKNSKYKIPKELKNKYIKILDELNVDKNINPSMKIMEYDKIYHKILLSVHYSWTFWDILKQKPVIIDDLNLIWELHKLRNKLAHDFLEIDNHTLEKKANDFYKENLKLLKRLS